MHLVKWIRKNMTKLMAVFVILIMVAFVMPSLLQQLAKPRYNNNNRPLWLYGQDGKVTVLDIKKATNELQILRALYADKIMMSQRDMKLILLGQMLFGPPAKIPPQAFCDQIKQVVMQMQIPVSSEKIDEFFKTSQGLSELYWVLLKTETAQAGISVSNQQVSEILKNIIPKITQNQTDAATLVKNLSENYQLTEDQILSVFAKMLAISSYANIVTNNTDSSGAMIRTMISNEKGKFNCEFVPFAADIFVDEVPAPTDDAINAQFNKYQDFFSYTITEENPKGFGYKIPGRVQLDYAIVKLDDVKTLISEPTPEETESFYQSNLDFYVEQVAKDPQDPNSEKIQRQKTYAEVADTITSSLMQRKIAAKSSAIISEIVEIVEADFEDINSETATAEDYKSKLRSYTSATDKVASKYGINITTGKTGLVTATDLQSDITLGSFVMPSQSRMPTPMTNIVFAIEELGITKVSPFETVKPKLYMSMSPLYDRMGKYVAAVRIIDFALPMAPTSVDFSYEKNMPVMDNDIDAEENVYSTRKLIVNDVKKIAAYEIAKAKANDFMNSVKTADANDWQKEIDKLNKKYTTDKSGPTFTLNNWTDRKVISQAEIQSIAMVMTGNINAEMIMSNRAIYKSMIDAFLAVVPTNKLVADNTPMVMNFEPALSSYVIKSISKSPATTDDYLESRRSAAFTQDLISAQAAGFDFFMPKNIKKRMQVKSAKNDKEITEPNDIAATK